MEKMNCPVFVLNLNPRGPSLAEEQEEEGGRRQEVEEALLQGGGAVAAVVLAVLAELDGYRAAGDLVGAGAGKGVPGNGAALADRHRPGGSGV